MTVEAEPAPRWFAVGRSGVVEELSTYSYGIHLGYSPGELAAIDLLTDDNYPMEDAIKLVRAAARSGKDPEAWARHFLELRKVVKQTSANPTLEP